MTSHAEDGVQLRLALSQLDERECRLIRLSYESKLSHAEIGLAEGTSTSQVSRCIANGMHKLAELLDADEAQRDVHSSRAIA